MFLRSNTLAFGRAQVSQSHWENTERLHHPPDIHPSFQFQELWHYTWTQLLVFLGFSMNDSPYICGSDGFCVHLVHSFITSRAWVNHLCSYRQVGRYYFILQMAITDREREIKCPAVPTEELCARASIQMFPAYMALKGSFHLKLLNCRPCDHKPCQLPAVKQALSKTNMGWEGDSAGVLVWATLMKQTWEMTKCHSEQLEAHFIILASTTST